MARIRSIKPEFFTSEQLADCSPTARLLFLGIIVHADDRGVHPASTRRLKMEVFPGDAFSDSDVCGFVQELLTARLLHEFEAENQRFWHVITFEKHQRVEKPTYRFPAPPPPQFDDSSTNDPRSVDDSSPSDLPRIGVESNGVESNGCNKEKSVADATSLATGVRENPEGASTSKRFVPPTVEEISAHIAEKGYRVDAVKFEAYYAAQGWRLKNGLPMKDWKKALITWERNEGDATQRNNGQRPVGNLRHGPGQIFHDANGRPEADRI